jgi:very-short-patch-repair endonuclease
VIQKKLKNVIVIFEVSTDFQKKLQDKEKIQLCESFFYFTKNPNLEIKKDFITKFHCEIFQEVKKSPPPESTTNHSAIKQKLTALYEKFKVESEVFMECGFHVDLLLTHKKTQQQIVIEIDGAHNKEKDAYRDEALKKLGLKVIHITNEELNASKNQLLLLDEKLAPVIKHKFPNKKITEEVKSTNSSYKNMFQGLAIEENVIEGGGSDTEIPPKTANKVAKKITKSRKHEEDIDQIIADIKAKYPQESKNVSSCKIN